MRERTRQAGPRLAAALVLLGLSAGGVAAQNEPSPATPPGNEGAPIPDTGVPPKSGTLSDQLSRSEGVIKPPPATTQGKRMRPICSYCPTRVGCVRVSNDWKSRGFTDAASSAGPRS